MIKDYLDEKLHEECGVFGVYRRDADLDVVGTTYYGLYALQHRGQESCGMAVNDDGVFYKRRELGLVNDVFTKDVLETMPRGNMCIGHCRYATTGVPVRSNAQPFVIRHIKGPMALAHNGNLTNSAELRSEFELSGAIFHSTSDTEVIAYAITRERLSSDSIEQAVEQTMDRLKGAYSLVVMSPRKLIAARDPQGFRPLCIGKLGENDIIASESCAITAAGGEFVRDVEPGEIVVFDENGCRSIRTHCKGKGHVCVFEYVYFARPDSVVDGASVEGRGPLEDIRTINRELEAYNPEIAARPQVIAANKIDAIYTEDGSDPVAAIRAEFEPKGIKVFPMSAVTGQGVKELLYEVNDMLANIGEETTVFAQEYFPESMTGSVDDAYTVTYDEEEDEYVVEGPKIEKMLGYTNLDSEKGFTFFQNFLKDTGILEELEALGIQEGDTVRMYGLSFDYYK